MTFRVLIPAEDQALLERARRLLVKHMHVEGLDGVALGIDGDQGLGVADRAQGKTLSPPSGSSTR